MIYMTYYDIYVIYVIYIIYMAYVIYVQRTQYSQGGGLERRASHHDPARITFSVWNCAYPSDSA